MLGQEEACLKVGQDGEWGEANVNAFQRPKNRGHEE